MDFFSIKCRSEIQYLRGARPVYTEVLFIYLSSTGPTAGREYVSILVSLGFWNQSLSCIPRDDCTLDGYYFSHITGA